MHRDEIDAAQALLADLRRVCRKHGVYLSDGTASFCEHPTAGDITLTDLFVVAPLANCRGPDGQIITSNWPLSASS